jgi:hypothetical protein
VIETISAGAETIESFIIIKSAVISFNDLLILNHKILL